MNKWMKSATPYEKDSKIQRQFEDDLVLLCVNDYVPLSLCDSSTFRKLIHGLDGRIRHVSRTCLTRVLIPNKAAKITESVGKRIDMYSGVCLAFDLWMTRHTEEFFSLHGHSMVSSTVNALQTFAPDCVHLGMPCSKTGTDGKSLSEAVMEYLQKWKVQSKVVGYVSDGGSNLKTCEDALDLVCNNTHVF
jgi:hypothetical protein